MAELEVRGILVHANVGVEAHERALKQPVELSVRVEYDEKLAVRSGKISDAVNYNSVLGAAKEAAAGGRFSLLEGLCSAVASSVLRKTAKARAVAVEASKPRVNVRKHARISVRVVKKR